MPPTPTPTPPLLGSRQNPVQFGTEVDVKNTDDDHWRIAIIDTVPDATQLVLSENPFNDPPEEGLRFYVVTIRAQYLGPDSTNVQMAGIGCGHWASGASFTQRSRIPAG